MENSKKYNILVLILLGQGLILSTDWLQAHYVAQAGPELTQSYLNLSENGSVKSGVINIKILLM